MTDRYNANKTIGSAWVSARYVQYFASLGEAFGLPISELLSDAGLSRSRFMDAESAIPVEALEFLLERLSDTYEAPLIGLQLASEVQPATFGVLGFLTQTCATFGEVVDVITRYNGLLSNIGHTSVKHDPGEVSLQWECRAGGVRFRRHATEYVLGSLAVLGRALLYGIPASPLSVRFAHAAPEKASLLVHYHALFRCPVYFDQPTAALVFPNNLLSVHLRHDDALIRKSLEQHAEELLQKRNRSNLVDDVSGLIKAMLAENPPGKEAVARQLGMSARSLHRGLLKEGTSYQELLDRTRVERAESLLIETPLPLEELALKVGFQSRQSFIRWYKRKTGHTPGEIRQKQKE